MTGTVLNSTITQSGTTISDSLSAIWNTISTVEGVWAILFFLFIICTIGNIVVLYFFFQGRRSIFLAKNLQRKIYFASSLSGARLQTEYDTIKSNKLYKIESTIIDIATNPTYFQNKNNIAIVIEYDASYANYPNIIQYAKHNDFAIVIYSINPTAITPDHRNLFQTYPYFEMCNSTGRVMSSLYNLLSIMPYGKK